MDEQASVSQQTFGGRFLCPKPGTNDVCGGALQFQYGTSATATTTNVESWSKSKSSEISMSVTLPDVFKVSVTLGLKEDSSGSKTTTQTYTTTTSVTEVRKVPNIFFDLKHLGQLSSLDCRRLFNSASLNMFHTPHPEFNCGVLLPIVCAPKHVLQLQISLCSSERVFCSEMVRVHGYSTMMLIFKSNHASDLGSMLFFLVQTGRACK